MSSTLPLVVGFGGYNSAGRASGHRSYLRTIYGSLSPQDQKKVRNSLASLMGCSAEDERQVLDGTLIRKIDTVFDPYLTPNAIGVDLSSDPENALSFELSARQLPSALPEGWEVQPLDNVPRRYRVKVNGSTKALLPAQSEFPVKAAGQLPTGFDPATYYKSTHHPRSLQLAILGCSDAVHSTGIDWQTVADAVNPEQVSVYASNATAQLDDLGMGGVVKGRSNGKRVSSKQLSLGFNSMPADFVNAYVLGSVGPTGAVTGACASFLYNLRWAVEEIRSGTTKVAIVGASEAPILPEVMEGFVAMGALASDENLMALDGTTKPDYRRASRPFGDNCGFTIAESSQYIVLMADDVAMRLGAEVYGAVPGVYVNADGYKKSISAPGAGNYITMARAVGLANTLLGKRAVQAHSFVHSHGSSTPHNRVTESKIIDDIARAFDIHNWPVAAVKSYVGHSLATASGDQLTSALGVFAHGILPGIKTIDRVADDVYAERLDIRNTDNTLQDPQVSFLNSKGFGGNNATATVLSPSAVENYLDEKFGKSARSEYKAKKQDTIARRDAYLDEADQGVLKPKYHFGVNMIDETKIKIDDKALSLPGFKTPVVLENNEGFDGF